MLDAKIDQPSEPFIKRYMGRLLETMSSLESSQQKAEGVGKASADLLQTMTINENRAAYEKLIVHYENDVARIGRDLDLILREKDHIEDLI